MTTYFDQGNCCWEGCSEQGQYPAPKSPDRPKERNYFCLNHIREYNRSWDFFRRMDNSQIMRFHKESMSGHRPTWKFGVGTFNYDNIEEIRSQVFGNPKGSYKPRHRSSEEQDAAMRLPKQARDALKTLGLSYPVSLPEVKKRYKELAKTYHPDVNGKGNDEKIKSINQAYNQLKAMNIIVESS